METIFICYKTYCNKPHDVTSIQKIFVDEINAIRWKIDVDSKNSDSNVSYEYIPRQIDDSPSLL